MGRGVKVAKKFLSSQLKHYIYIHTESCACVCVCAFNHNGSNNKPIKNNFSWQKNNFGGWNEFQEMQVLDSLDYKYLFP